MRLYILGICGTFMGGVARLACEQGHEVGGMDANMYPPMDNQLKQLGIELHKGYQPDVLKQWRPDLVVVGNALSRGNPVVETILNEGIRYTSGPQWMAENVLGNRWVLAVAGTHGKTTTASLLSWLLEHAGFDPGFLIGGVPENFGVSARTGTGPHFVIEADEYDTAFFDKRSKFVHYQPRTLVLNNLEYDHADIFDDIEQIKQQFHHLVRIVPGKGLILINGDDRVLPQVMARGCWSEQRYFSIKKAADWTARATSKDYSRFEVGVKHKAASIVRSPLIGAFNMSNALAAVAAAHHAGVATATACEGVNLFRSVKRRLQLRATINGISIYDDFAHHPTAIHQTLLAMKQFTAGQRLICVLEPRSNTMLMGKHQTTLARSFSQADLVFVYKPSEVAWDMDALVDQTTKVSDSVPEIVRLLASSVKTGDHIVVMSNGSFDNIHEKLIDALNVIAVDGIA